MLGHCRQIHSDLAASQKRKVFCPHADLRYGTITSRWAEMDFSHSILKQRDTEIIGFYSFFDPVFSALSPFQNALKEILKSLSATS